jgi:hypothetical protein
VEADLLASEESGARVNRLASRRELWINIVNQTGGYDADTSVA